MRETLKAMQARIAQLEGEKEPKEIQSLSFGGRDMTVDFQHGVSSGSSYEFYANTDRADGSDVIIAKDVTERTHKDESGNKNKSVFKTYSDDGVTKAEVVQRELQSGSAAAKKFAEGNKK